MGSKIKHQSSQLSIVICALVVESIVNLTFEISNFTGQVGPYYLNGYFIFVFVFLA